MNSRIVKWGIEKWKLHEQHYDNEISEAFEVLNAECHKPSSYLAGKPIRHIRNVKKSCPKDAGLGIDQQVLPLWANLPDEALKGLHLIIRAMLDGKCPLQALLVLIGFLTRKGEARDRLVLLPRYIGLLCAFTRESLVPEMNRVMPTGTML